SHSRTRADPSDPYTSREAFHPFDLERVLRGSCHYPTRLWQTCLAALSGIPFPCLRRDEQRLRHHSWKRIDGPSSEVHLVVRHSCRFRHCTQRRLSPLRCKLAVSLQARR